MMLSIALVRVRNSTTISAEKIEVLKRLAEKASKTYPLPFSEIPQKEDIFNQGKF